jgi:hypothetical protein
MAVMATPARVCGIGKVKADVGIRVISHAGLDNRQHSAKPFSDAGRRLGSG